MNAYLFDKENYDRFYRCDYMSQDGWANYAVRKPTIGVIFIALGVVYMVTYIPCLIVMRRQSFYKNSCFKIMFFMGLLDTFCLLINCFETGYFMFAGSVFCMSPNFQYITGTLAVGGWSGQCMFCVVLAFNRCIDFWSKRWSELLFEGFKTYLWIAIPFSYMLFYIFFTPAATFTSAIYMWFFDPYITMPADVVSVDHSAYVSFGWAHSMNDYVVISCLVILYTALIVSIRVASRGGGHTKTQLKIVLQAGIICLLNFIPALVFTVAKFFQPPPIFVFLCVISYQLGNGGAGLVLLTLNRTIRTNVIVLILSDRVVKMPTPVVTPMTRIPKDDAARSSNVA